MTQEDKNILLQDLCNRLPYGVKCEIKGYKEVYTLNRIEIDYENGHLFDFKEQKNGFNVQVYSSEVKPYLFPMSSMTEEQEEELKNIYYSINNGMFYYTERIFDKVPFKKMKYFPYQIEEFFKKNHIDYRGLIPMGLALNATNLNIY